MQAARARVNATLPGAEGLLRLGLTLALLGCHQQTMPASDAPLSARDRALIASIDAYTRARIAADSFSGVVVLTHHDVPIYQRLHGAADRATGAAHTLDTKFNLASLGKYYTRLAIWQLQQAGKLSLSDHVGKHLPDYPNDRVRNEVTIRHLVYMRSGLPGFGDDDNYAAYLAGRHNLRTLDDYLALFASKPLRFTPGSQVAYSNPGYIVLGKIIEQVSGLTYYDYVQRHIFDPAGMTGSGFFSIDQQVPLLAIGYTSSPAVIGNFADGAPALPGRMPNDSLLPYRGSSAGGGYSTANDLLAFARALRAHRLLDSTHTESFLEFGTPAPGTFEWSGWAGGDSGVNAILYLHSTGHALIVLSNYDPPSAQEYRRLMWNEWLPAWLKASVVQERSDGAR